MTRLHMQTTQVLAVARQLAQTAQEIETQTGQIEQRVRGIPWEGPGRDEYVTHMNQLVGQIQQKAQEGILLSQRMNREVEEWLSNAASFGECGSAVITTITISAGASYTAPALANMRDLAELVMTGSRVIRIYRIGENQYLLVVQGTNINDPNVSNNMGSAITTGLGLSSDFQNQVKLALLSLPSGAIIHIAGHSQGGIVSENLAVDKEVKKHFDKGYGIQSVTTFGSPVSAPENTDVAYYRYAAEGDIVPYLEGRDALTVSLLSPVFGLTGASAIALLNRAPQTSIPADFSGGIFGPHGEYKDSKSLEQITELPFKVDKEYLKIKPETYDPGEARSGLAVVQKNLSHAAETTGSFVQTANMAISGVTESTGNFFANLF